MATGHRFDPTILREYDMRGIVGETLFEADAHALGRTLGTMIGQAGGVCACVGYDGRHSSPALAAALTEGFLSAGISVVSLGLVPTPALYFAVHMLGMDGGVVVTGSHNPPNYNGFKLMLGTKPLWGKDITAIGERAAAGDWRTGIASSVSVDILSAYTDRMLVDYGSREGLAVAWDSGNGAMGPAMEMLTAKLPGTHHLLNAKVDGDFPAHHPDPTVPENLAQLQAEVARQKCTVGIAFDGDGDRIGVVDGDGRIVWGDQLVLFLARDLLQRKPGSTILADVKASQVLFDEVARLGGNPVMCPTGHSIVKARMAELEAPLAGEMSGHIFYKDNYYGFDDGLYTAVRLLDIIARTGASLSEFLDALPPVLNTPELRFEVPEERKFAIIDEAKKRLAGGKAEVIDIDGVRVITEDGWWLLRASNTQNSLVVRCEAKDEAGLGRLKATVAEQLEASGVTAPAF